MTCEQLIAPSEIALLAKAMAVLCFAVAASIVSTAIWLWWCKT